MTTILTLVTPAAPGGTGAPSGASGAAGGRASGDDFAARLDAAVARDTGRRDRQDGARTDGTGGRPVTVGQVVRAAAEELARERGTEGSGEGVVVDLAARLAARLTPEQAADDVPASPEDADVADDVAAPTDDADAAAELTVVPAGTSTTDPEAEDASRARATGATTGDAARTGTGAPAAPATGTAATAPAVPTSPGPDEVPVAPTTAQAAAGGASTDTARAGTDPRATAGPAPAQAVTAAPTVAPDAVGPVAAPAAPSGAAAVNATAPAAPAPPSVPADLAQQLSDQLGVRLAGLRAAGAGEHVLTLRVDPESFGPVRVVAHITPEGVRVELLGATDAARDALRAALPDLRRDLAGSGLGNQLDLGAEDRAGGQDGLPRQRTRTGAPDTSSAGAADATATAPTTTRAAHGGIDLLA